MAILPKSSSAVVTATAWAHGAQQKMQPVIESTKSVLVSSYNTILEILDRYPPIKAFLISLVLFSFVPITLFLGFVGLSSSIVFGVATGSAAIFQGCLLGFGGFVLFWFLIGSLFFAGLATFWFTVGFFGLRTAKKLAA